MILQNYLSKDIACVSDMFVMDEDK
jgi:hypothetical protein